MTAREREGVIITTREALLNGDLAVPDDAIGVVLFVHGSGSSRFSRRNQAVAQTLNDSGLATF